MQDNGNMSAAAAKPTTRQKFERFYYFFPLQLFLLQLKRNYLLLFCWLLLFLFITQNFATKYGAHYLFLYPEYLGNVDFLSHLIIGFACGGFIMAFNISTYIINGYKFPFLATLSKPFLKYCINNFLIPGTFVLSYLFLLIKFQLFNEIEPISQVIMNISGFITGNLIFIYITLLYFRYTNKDIFKLFGFDIESKISRRREIKRSSGFAESAFHKRVKWYHFFHRLDEWRVDTYLNGVVKISLARDSKHYHKSLLQTVFAQNHINASLFELMVISTLIILGLFRELPTFQIPAGASVFLLLTIIIMIGSALHSWLKGWSNAALLVTILLAVFISKYNVLSYTNYAYGMDYKNGKANYNIEELQKASNDPDIYTADTANTIAILNKWLATTSYQEDGFKPKLLLINTSGGGLRSMMWTVHALQYADSSLEGKVLKNARLISGASGGMMGASYIRELYLRKITDPSINLYDDKHLENISQDILNPVAFSLTLNDIFFRVQKFKLGEHKYTKDRGYIFEQILNRNTSFILNKTIADYREPERMALIPMMVISPTIINDGRRMIISSQPVS
ncbi:MAG: patatin-like phospholipase family protein, partial [Bacteroidia bacterium]